MKLTICLTAVLLAATIFAAAPQEKPAKKVDELNWLSGCWQVVRAGSDTIEQWTTPGGGMMLGTSRTIKDGRTTEYEFLKITEENGTLVYTAKPSAQPEASFKLSPNSNGGDLVFENPTHDFPQRIIYSPKGNNALVARVEGTMNGKSSGIDFPMNRVACGTAAIHP